MRELDYKQLVDEIQSWIQDLVKSAIAENIVVGMSGGIDSSVTTALCVRAIGKEKVFGFSLPCESNPEDIEDAQFFASKLNVNFKVIEITSIYETFLSEMRNYVKPNQQSVANLKARLRMASLYFFGQSLGKSLVAGTGNRAELAIGYFTKYGDGGVDFEPIGMLYKNEVRKIAKLLDIPDRIINKPPSPGLWPGQTDEGEIGLSYDKIDEILYRMDYNLPLDDLNSFEIEKVRNLMRKAEHKQALPSMFAIN